MNDIWHKNKIKADDELHGIMERGLGHRRLRKMVEEFSDIHQYLVEELVKIKDEEKWIYIVFVFLCKTIKNADIYYVIYMLWV